MTAVDQATLADILRRVEADGYRLRPDERSWDVVEPMLRHLGDPDEELRDLLIYPTFRAWIAERPDRFTDDELRRLLDDVTDDAHLFHGIGRTGDPSVFARTFSVLVLALLLGRHRTRPFLDPAGFRRAADALLRYCREERDLRGHLADGGWAHAAAHAADALDELARCSDSDADLRRAVLDAVRGFLHNGTTILAEEEDERLATVVDAMITDGLLPHDEITDWLHRITDCADEPPGRTSRIARVNTRNLLRSLWFRHPGGGPLAEAVGTAQARVNRFAT